MGRRPADAPGRSARAWRGGGAVVVALALLGPVPAGAAAQEPSRGVEELWEEYPLEAPPAEERSTEPEAGSGTSAAPAAPAGERSPAQRRPRPAPPDGSDVPGVVMGAAGAAAAGLAGLVVVLRRRRRQRGEPALPPGASPAPALASPAPPVAAEAAEPAGLPLPAMRLQARRPSWLTASGARRGPGGADFRARPRARPPRGGGHDEKAEPAPPGAPASPASPTAPAPPAPAAALPQVAPPRLAEAWTAEIAWDPELSSFAVGAVSAAAPDRSVVLARTEALRWPPPDAAAVQALADAIGSVRMVLEGSGWTALPSAGPWYALRFAWAPREAPPGLADSAPCTSGASAGPA